MKPFVLGLLSRDRVRLERWKLLFSSQGWPVESAAGLAELAALAAASRMGLGLLDLSQVTSTDVGSFKSKFPSFVCILVGDSEPRDGAEAARCLEEGAEDYVAAGLDERVLTAKLRAHLRRLLPAYADWSERLQDPSARLRVDRKTRLVTAKDGKLRWKAIEGLTPTEFRILCFFLERPDVALDRPALLEGVWQERSGGVNPETLDRHVESLRKKLGAFGSMIETIYGVGYVLRGDTHGPNSRR